MIHLQSTCFIVSLLKILTSMLALPAVSLCFHSCLFCFLIFFLSSVWSMNSIKGKNSLCICYSRDYLRSKLFFCGVSTLMHMESLVEAVLMLVLLPFVVTLPNFLYFEGRFTWFTLSIHKLSKGDTRKSYLFFIVQTELSKRLKPCLICRHAFVHKMSINTWIIAVCSCINVSIVLLITFLLQGKHNLWNGRCDWGWFYILHKL